MMRSIDWIELSQDRAKWKPLVNMIMNLQVPEHFGKFLSSCTPAEISRRARLQGVR
jgi:hypothetical protein